MYVHLCCCFSKFYFILFPLGKKNKVLIQLSRFPGPFLMKIPAPSIQGQQMQKELLKSFQIWHRISTPSNWICYFQTITSMIVLIYSLCLFLLSSYTVIKFSVSIYYKYIYSHLFCVLLTLRKYILNSLNPMEVFFKPQLLKRWQMPTIFSL